MANGNISDYHGLVRECDCGLYSHPERQGERACRVCFGRGFVAECLACNGKGKTGVPVNGSDPSLGTMASTCSKCGGGGAFGVNKPADWQDLVPEPAAKEAVPEETPQETPAEETPVEDAPQEPVETEA